MERWGGKPIEKLKKGRAEKQKLIAVNPPSPRIPHSLCLRLLNLLSMLVVLFAP